MACFLLDHGADINKRGLNGWNPLFAACSSRCGYLGMVDLLLARGADPSIRNPHSGATPLIFTACEGSRRALHCLLKDQRVLATTDAQDIQGQTALHKACYHGRSDVVRVLLEAGADPTVADINGHTVMDIAKHKGQGESVVLLEVSHD